VRRDQVRVALLTIEGTNCDGELFVALRGVGARPEVVHLKQLEGREVPPGDRRHLAEYSLLLLPGGFSAGDYVRAGAILAARLRAAIGPELEEFLRGGGFVGGICNGFQVLTELGLLPGAADGRLGAPDAVLMANDSGHFECRPTYVRWDGGRFAPLRELPAGTVLFAPSAHAEGKLVLAGDAATRARELAENGQVLFRWVDPHGAVAGYPWNPNGSVGHVAGLTNRTGTVFGVMPHPERAFFRAQHPDWTRSGSPAGAGDGRRFFDALVDHLARRG
jgi:phosphoribosylformylglycinamidine synthase subunit PurQ / glutaminase